MPKKQLQFDVLTLFPNLIETYASTSILKRAQEKGVVKVVAHQIRDFATDKHHTTDETPYGGGAGMVLMAAPILRGVEHIQKKNKRASKKRKIIILSAKGKPFTQKLAIEYATKYEHLVLVAGRYEGIDERVLEILSASGGKADEISVGPYVLTDGDVGAMIVVSAVARLIPGAIRLESLAEESHWNKVLKEERESKTLLEYPHYTRPEVITWKGKKYRVPKVLLSGHHKDIDTWRTKQRRASRH